MSASAQRVSASKEKPIHDEHTAPGKLISAGKNSTPVGPLKAKTYRLEEVPLNPAIEYQTPSGEKAVLQSVFRLTITLDSLPINDYIIWLDGLPLPAYVSGDARVGSENAVSVLMYGPRILAREGATLAISTYSQKKERSTLTEKLGLPEKFGLPHDMASRVDPSGPCTRIESIRSFVRISEEGRTPMVGIVIQCPKGLPILNSVTTLMIDDKAFMGGQGTFDMTAAQFAALEDRSPVFLQHGPLTIRLGRLDKSMLDR